MIPRPETELLVELLVGRACAAPERILDLGTGTGAIALALAKHYPAAQVVAVDMSDDALALAAENAASLGLSERVTFVKSRWFEALPASGRFDVVVSNPPYLAEAETAEAEPEVKAHEPISALTAADGGISDLKEIIAGAPAFLKPGGLLALETGIGHHADLLRLLADAGMTEAESRRDLTDRDRFVFARAAGA